MTNDLANKPISGSEAAKLFGPFGRAPVLVLAVSGGPDSTALLWLAARFRGAADALPKLVAVTVDHALRKDSAREARAVKQLAQRLGVEHRTLRWTGRKPKTGIQEAARNARYRLLARAAREAGSRHIVTAHTLDDQAETVLFRLVRGSGIRGLAGMQRVDRVPVPEGQGVDLVRPFLQVPKARLIATLKGAKVPYAADPSNDDPRFARPRLRKIMSALAREGLTIERLARLAQRAGRTEEALVRMVADAQLALWPGASPSEDSGTIAADAFLELPPEIGLRLLERMILLRGRAGPPELGQLETLYGELAAAEGGPLRRTLAGAMVTLSEAKLTVERAPPRRQSRKTP
jgi:tRNA(Ile)-lysidine synthase